MQRLLLIVPLILIAVSAFAFDFGLSLNFAGGQKKCTDLVQNTSVSPTEYAFANQSTGTTADAIFTYSNTGTAQLSAAELAVSGTSFTLQSTTCGENPFDLAAGADCTATVRFAPLTASEFTGSLTMSAPNLDDLVASLSGTGTESAPVGPLLSDTFDTDTLSNYTAFTTTAPIYDATNHRPKGQTAATFHGMYYPTAAATNNYEVSCLSYLYASGYSGPFWNGNGAGTSSTGYYLRINADNTNLQRRNSDGSVTYVNGWDHGTPTWTSGTTHLTKVVITGGTSFRLFVDWNDDGDYGEADEDLGVLVDATYSGTRAGILLYGLSAYSDNLIIQEN